MKQAGLGATDVPLNVSAAEGEVVVTAQDNALAIALMPPAAAEPGRRMIEVARSVQSGDAETTD
ncbi:hypothetical protein [Caulobacter sp. S45]|jgi:hypothetical protein|uniref:hypothetical protein n=1 Tax=Caulobacter sp. S45 TaxID=1641861 RepID=UPI00131B39BA|nr:hypothetical protein [Caulobacter sp. S45]